MDTMSKSKRAVSGFTRARRKSKPPRSRLPGRFTWEDYASRMFEAIDTPVSLGCYLRLRYGCFDQLAAKTVRPNDYLHPDDFFVDYQAVSLLRKAEFLPTTIDRRETAIRKFLEAESNCAQVNREIFEGNRFVERRDREVVHLASRKIAAILGDVPDLEQLDFSFGPGANSGVRGDTSVFKKLHSQLECSFALLPILEEFLSEFPSWDPAGSRPVDDGYFLREVDVDVVEGSELTFVPKDATTLRPICIEPLLESLYQKGIGKYIRSRLRRWGVQLNDQGVNQRLASVAHHLGLTTVDLSSASDCISYGLVMELLPFPWFEFLERGRCSSYHVEDNWYSFHKFTSMGNAYTFELETLIFFALALASCEVDGVPFHVGENLHVYGDDIILPREAFRTFHSAISRCGFSVNSEKTFHDSNFYESCGTDWFLGLSVRPFFLRKAVLRVEDLYYVANSTLRVVGTLLALCENAATHGRCISPSLDRLGDLHAWVVSTIPRRDRLCGPPGHGEGHLHTGFDIACPTRARNGWDGWTYRTRPPTGRRTPLGEDDVQTMAYAVYFTERVPAGTDQIREHVLPDSTSWSLRRDSLYLRIGGLGSNSDLDFGSSKPQRPGYGYNKRGHVRFKTSRAFVGPVWPDCPPWTSRAIELVTEKVRDR